MGPVINQEDTKSEQFIANPGNLPTEIWVNILSKLKIIDLIRVSEATRFFQDAGQDKDLRIQFSENFCPILMVGWRGSRIIKN